MKIMKFGGTALATSTTREKCMRIIEKDLPEKTIVICSAMGRNGFPYATDTLRALMDKEYVEGEELDRILSFGEILSSLIFTQDLRKKGIKAKSISPHEVGIMTDDHFQNAKVIRVNTTAISQALQDYDVVVVPGFIGMTKKGVITTLGKGGSDLTATLLADALQLQDVYLWKDVEGVYPYYPFATYGLHHYQALSYDEMLSLCELGYEIIQQKAIQYAKEKQLHLHIGHYVSQEVGTTISTQTHEKKIIGFSANYQSMQIATSMPKEIWDILQEILKKSHIFIKDVSFSSNHVHMKVSSSQIPIVRKILIEHFFR